MIFVSTWDQTISLFPEEAAKMAGMEVSKTRFTLSCMCMLAIWQPAKRHQQRLAKSEIYVPSFVRLLLFASSFPFPFFFF